MPSRNELRAMLTELTHESFVSPIMLAKTSYKDAEANQVQLQALISFHGMMYVDEILCKINASKTTFPTEHLRQILRSLYNDNSIYKTKFNRDLSMRIHTELGAKTTIGRNQATELLLTCIKAGL